jgi:hypothetical protein
MTATTDPTGAFSRALYNLRVSLADCTVFRSWAGAGSRADALKRIYIGDPPPPVDNSDTRSREGMESIRPFAVVDIPQSGILFKRAGVGAAMHVSIVGGALSLLLEQDVPKNLYNEPSEMWIQFWNTVGRICRRDVDDAGTVDGLLDLDPTTDDYLPITEITPLFQYRAEEDEIVAQGDHVGCVLQIVYGGR